MRDWKVGEWKIGDRVRVTTVPRQPPPHAGDEGTITGTEPVEFGDMNIAVPIITLDGGTVLKGYECWWVPM